MTLGIALLAGITGTLIMTGFTEFMALLLKKPFHVITILAIMLPLKKRVESPNILIYCVATVIHYLIGVIFSYFYQWLILHGWINHDLLSAVIFGSLIGTVAVIVWGIFFSIHPNPPPIELKPYLTVIWIGHTALALTLIGIFKLFLKPSALALIPMC